MTVGLVFPVLVNEFLFDTGLGLGEVCAEELPCCVEHLIDLDVYVDCKDSCGICLRIVKTSEVVVAQVETVLQLGLRVLCVSVETYGCVHHLAVVLSCLLALNELLQTGAQGFRVPDGSLGNDRSTTVLLFDFADI